MGWALCAWMRAFASEIWGSTPEADSVTAFDGLVVRLPKSQH